MDDYQDRVNALANVKPEMGNDARRWLAGDVTGNELSGTSDYAPTRALWNPGTKQFTENPAWTAWHTNYIASGNGGAVTPASAPITSPAASQGQVTPSPTPSSGAVAAASGGTSVPTNTTGGVVSSAMQQAQNPFANLAPVTNMQTQQSVIDPTKETVAGQLNTLLSEDNPLYQRAQALAIDQMGARGRLRNSTMSGQAGVAAYMDKATQVATPDAQTYAQRNMFNTDAQNAATMFNAGETNKLVGQGADIASRFGLQQNEFEFNSGENALNRTSNEKLTQLKIQSDTALAQAQLAHDSAMTNLKIAADAANADRSVAAQQALLKAQQEFQGTQSELDRLQQTSAQLQQQLFQGTQADLDRTTQTSILGLQQVFQGQQAELDRANQRLLVDLQAGINAAAIPKTYTAEIVSNLARDVSSIAASPDMDAAGKTAQIENLYKAANSAISSLEALYNTELPSVTQPANADALAADVPVAEPVANKAAALAGD